MTYTVKDKPEVLAQKLNEAFIKTHIGMISTFKSIKDVVHEPCKIKKEVNGKYFINFGTLEGPEGVIEYGPTFDDFSVLATLGFKEDEYRDALSEFTVANASTLPVPIVQPNLIFIYCDIVREHNVGDSMSNCLRVIPLTSGDDKTVSSHSFSMPYYFPVRYGMIKSISIKLCDEMGEPIKFSGGRTLVTLKFRKKLYKAGILKNN